MIYKMELSDSVDTMVFDLLEVPIVDKDITGIAENTTIDGNVYEDYLWLKKQYVQKWSIMCQDEYDRLRGFWTRQFGNAEVPFYRLFYGDNIYEDRNFLTSDGFTQILNPTERLAPTSLTHLYGNATQETIPGINQISLSEVDIDDGHRIVSYSGSNITAGTHTISFDLVSFELGTNTSVNLTFRVGSTQDTNIINLTSSTTLGRKTYTYSINDAATSGEFRIGLTMYNAGGRIKISNVQLEEGSVAHDYTPFVGGVDSPNPNYPQDVKTVSGAQTVKICGKNLLDPTPLNPLVFEGTISNHYYYDAKLWYEVEAGETYTISVYVDSISVVPYQFLALLGKASMGMPTVPLKTVTNLTTIGGRVSATFTVSQAQIDRAGGNMLFMRIPNYSSPTTASYKISDIMVEKSATATDYEPYQSQSQVIDLVLGKNRFSGNFSQFDNRGGYGTTYAYFKLPDDDEYILSLKAKNNVPAQSQPVFIGFSAQGGQSAGGVRWVWTNTTTASAGDIKYANNLPSGAGENMHFVSLHAPTEATLQWFVENFYIQLEKGTAPTDYEAYNTIELAKIGNYTDGIKQGGDKWYIHKEIGKAIWDGSESWTTASNYCFHTESDAYVPESRDVVADILCDNFTPTSYLLATGTTLDYAIALDSNNAGRFALRHKDYLSASTLKTWLSTHPTTVYYALATPTDTEITDSELIEQLNHIYELYQGTNNLWLIPSAGAQGEIEGTYRLIYEEETDIVPKTPVVLTLTDGGVINPCGCRQNIQLIMRETEGN